MTVALPLTKIVATIGTPGTPGCTREVVHGLISAGVTVFRLNFSHGTAQGHEETAALIRTVSQESGHEVALLGDLSGPKIRIGPVQEGGVRVRAGEDVVLQTDEILATGPVFSSTYPDVIADVQVGQRVFVNDGAVRMAAIASQPGSVICRVLTGGLITTGKGINLPDTELTLSSPTPVDLEMAQWAIAHGIDMMAQSFVRHGSEVRTLRRFIDQASGESGESRIPIIAKIEKPQAVANIEGIIAEADAIMVARGDLGVEMEAAEIPIIQKRLVRDARSYGRPAIVATQMLESMIHHAAPTRAEVSDVANAILDGADAVMLSAETAIGKYPVLAAEMMRKIARVTEQWEAGRTHRSRGDGGSDFVSTDHWIAALAAGAATIVRDVNARLVVCWSELGATAMHLSLNRYPIPIVACSSRLSVVRRLGVLRGVRPVQMPTPATLDEFTARIDQFLVDTALVDIGDPVVLIAGHPIGTDRQTNSLAVHYVGNPSTGYRGH
ncbi:MAG: pyruvate kinase [Planctomycetes bacterium]|nr:pyruvate kinase [Planctomycetota bacterium]NOG54156.1 pyruvate kinase [Planctomycetota bacterium]